MTEKYFIDAQSLQEDAFRLAADILDSGFRPTFIVALWRGGASVGATIQELLASCGCDTDHIAIRTSSYRGVDQRDRNIRVHGLNYLVERLTDNDSLLLVDDVHDTGLSLQEVLFQINQRCQQQPREIRIATLYYKPARNQVDFKPDYYLHENDDWLVFPHELEGLTDEEIRKHKPDIAAIREWLLNWRKQTNQE